jgi:hypothetical protein
VGDKPGRVYYMLRHMVVGACMNLVNRVKMRDHNISADCAVA